MDNNSIEILVPLNNSNTTNIKARFKRVRVIGKSNPYLTTNKDKHIKIKEPVKGGFRYSSKYINTIEKYLNRKLNNVDKEKTTEPVEVFKHLKSLNLFEPSNQ